MTMFSEPSKLERLTKAVDKLDEVSADVGSILQLFEFQSNPLLQDHSESNDHQTSSMLASTDTIGRENDKNRVMDWLTNDLDVYPSNKLPVFAIIGVGGIGKTTLAQIVYRELADTKLFDHVLWAHVSSNTFNATKVTKKILEAIIHEKPNADTLEALQHKLENNVKAKKFLLVLDDVWEDGGNDEWEKLLAPLRTSVKGSRILLTTRMRSAADMVANAAKGKMEYLNLDGLNEENICELFKKCALDGIQPGKYKHLLPVATTLAKKFRGCPMLAKLAGGRLKSNLSHQHWEDLDTQLDHLEGRMDDIIRTVLLSSYNHLPANLQLCFRYCSIFPQDYEFNKEELVKMWMASGLIEQDTRDERPEDTGERYLMQLTSKSFFTFVPIEYPCGQDYMGYYTMHDMLHDLARTVSLGECLRLVPSNNKYNIQTVRHMWIANFSKLTTDEIMALSHSKHLRTLVIDDSHDTSEDYIALLEKAVENLKCLRLLVLKNIPKFHFPSKAANKHLRYLHFSGTQEVCGFAKLYHLQVLTVSDGIRADMKETKELGSISSLRYVSYGDKGFGVFPVGGLHSLQELHNFKIQSKDGYRISSLCNLTSLCELKVSCLENVGSMGEVVEAELNKKHRLKSLSLSWSEQNVSSRAEDESVIEKLEPHGNLKKLEISGYGGAELPTWIKYVSLTNLVSLKLRQCLNWQYLPDLGKLERLKHLEMQKLTGLEYIGQSSEKSLPPNMMSLVVKDCEKLCILPLLPLSLMQLELEKVGLTNLPIMSDTHGEMGFEGTPPRLFSVIIIKCSNLTSLEGSFLQQEHCIRGLRILNIVDCDKLESALLLFGKMNDLTEFHIGRSVRLKMKEKVDGALLPGTLKQLAIVRCGELQGPLQKSLLGLTNLTSLNIHRCSMESLPSSDVFKSLTALRNMVVEECMSLTSLGGLGALSYLTWLKITGCEKLLSVIKSGKRRRADEEFSHEEFSLQVYLLWVDRFSVVNLQPLRRLRNTKSLIIETSGDTYPHEWMEQNRESLESLEIDKGGCEQTLQALCSLKRFEIHDANERTYFPAALPTSLDYFIVRNYYGNVEERWRWSSEWNMISRITHVRIGSTGFSSTISLSIIIP